MNKKEIQEIKKQFQPVNCNITRIATCYVDYNKNIILNKTESFLSLPEEEEFKYFELFKKALSGGKGKTLYDVEFPTVNGGTEKENFLNELRKSKLGNKEVLEDFYQKVIDSYQFGENYLIILIHGVYDIPGKASDESVMEDASDEVYEHLMCCICPVALSKPGLSINSVQNKVENRNRDWVVDMPAHAFLYPAFNDRTMDVHSMLYYSKKTSDMQPELVFELSGIAEPLVSGDEEQKALKEELQERSNITFDTMQAFSEKALEALEEMPDNYKVSMKGLNNMLIDSGLDGSEAEAVVNGLKDRFGDQHEFLVENLTDKSKVTVKIGSATVKLDPEALNDIEMKTIGNRLCIVLPLSENLAEFNGVLVKSDQ